MIRTPKKIAVFQTAFLGDVVLTLPLIQVLKRNFPSAELDVVVIPRGAEILEHHPSVSKVIRYDKRKTQKGIAGILSLSRRLRQGQYDTAIVPHRSFRSALITWLANIPVRISYSTSAGKYFFTHLVPYRTDKHEIERNLSLLAPLGIIPSTKELPTVYPTIDDVNRVSKLLFEREVLNQSKMIAVAPGSVWNTKRWLLERFTELSVLLAEDGWEIMIIGGNEDRELGRTIYEIGRHKNIHDLTGQLTLLQSAELIGRCSVLVSNDSAPLHLGVAMRTPVVAIFGATSPSFGFAPYGKDDIVVETLGLPCRPCAIHGGNVCPIGTFDCMKKIEAQTVYEKVHSLLVVDRVKTKRK